ncbi:kinase-like domain-containing protein [Aspergillus cavernicola]|uniref:Kinase-like domain-containing protein n=1 Tax=Aspergillus cavernicola TaxID=176166 RepID=A0ABR4IBF6_9EURO
MRGSDLRAFGDCIGKYKVIHKLGFGGSNNVWLCRVLHSEPIEYVAVKILLALTSTEGSGELVHFNRVQELAKSDPMIDKYCLLPLDYFLIKGPDGTHQCFVYPAAGPSLMELSKEVDNPHKSLRSLARQTAKAMLRSIGMESATEVNVRPENILLRLDSLAVMSEDEVLNALGEPIEVPIVLAEGFNDPELGRAPYGVIYPIDFGGPASRLASERICVIDFSESYDKDSPPPLGLALPGRYGAPELALGHRFSMASDIWSLAPTIFSIRTGHVLFDTYDPCADHVISCMVQLLGPLPEPWWSTVWKQRGVYFKDELDAEGNAVKVRVDSSSKYDLQESMSWWVGNCVPRGYYEHFTEFRCKLSKKEKDLLEDLIRMMCQYDPEKRPTIEQVLQHPWDEA